MTHNLRISLFPHEQDWRTGCIHRRTQETRLPLIGYPLESGLNEANINGLPIMTIEGKEMELSSFRLAEEPNEYLIRLYDILGERGNCTLKFSSRIRRAILIDFLGNEIGELAYESNAVILPVDPYSIITMKVQLDKEI